MDIFYHYGPVCNRQLKRMWDRTLRVSRVARFADRYNRLLPGYEAHVVPMNQARDSHGSFARTQAHLSFTPAEEAAGRQGLRALGIPEGAPFICLLGRDSAYLSTLFPGMCWNYHQYRNTTIHNFIPAAEELVRHGHFAVRMGAIVSEALHCSNPKIIDYAIQSRTDFLDIYLSAKCDFFLSSSSGIDNVASIFRRPIAYVNLIPLREFPDWGPNDLVIPKKLWLSAERRFLTFREILESGAGQAYRTQDYERLGVEVIENTPEEITALAVEMDERLNNTWQTSEEDEELQIGFRSLFNVSKQSGAFLSRMGAVFLRENRFLLD